MAVGDQLIRLGTALILRDTAGGAAQWAVKNTLTLAGRLSPVIDLGAEPRPSVYDIFRQCQWASAPASKAVSDWFLFEWHNETGPANPDGQVPSVDTAYAAASAGLAKADNGLALGPVFAETAAAGPFSSSVRVTILRRHISIMVINQAGVSFVNTDDLTFARITPVYAQIQ